MTIASIVKSFVNLIYPLHCAGCKKILDPSNDLGACDLCIRQIRPNPKPHCRSCGRSIETAEGLCPECRKTRFYFDRAYSAYLYDGAMKELICSFKYRGALALAKILSRLAIAFVNENKELLKGIDVITFVPLHKRSLRLRGFNQSKILALNISRGFSIPVADTLEKFIMTRRQNELQREDRISNLKGAFKVKRGASLKDKRLLLVDDIMTTGATLSECSRVLSGSGVKEVRCFTLARGNYGYEDYR